jgi:hypothetical protein
VIGLMDFGFWTAPAWNGGHGASDIPLTVDADERIAARILANNPTGPNWPTGESRPPGG